MKIQEVCGLLLETNMVLSLEEKCPVVEVSLNYSISCTANCELMQWNINSKEAAWWWCGTIRSDTLCSIYDVHTHIWEYL